jgi:hypothetical protein
MEEFFKGWRRKAGCVTLMLAGAFCSVWHRSYSTFDRIDGFMAARLIHGYVVSTNGDLNIIRRFPLPPDYAMNSLHLKKWVFWRTKFASRDETVLLERNSQISFPTPDCWSEFTVAWRFDFAGFHCGKGRHSTWDSWDVQLWVIPYWMITLTLSLLSVYLILWKPRLKAKVFLRDGT